MVIFTTLHGDTGWLVAALFVWGFELVCGKFWIIGQFFRRIQSYIPLVPQPNHRHFPVGVETNKLPSSA